MARGWESKSVEEQQSEAGRERGPARPPKSAEEIARETRRASLGLARARALSDLQAACNAQHRALLERTLAHLEAELAALGEP